MYGLEVHVETVEVGEHHVRVELLTTLLEEFFLAADDNLLELAQTCTCRDEVAADYVLLHTFECVALAADSCFVEYLGCLLE